jgi:hypothetical protein
MGVGVIGEMLDCFLKGCGAVIFSVHSLIVSPIDIVSIRKSIKMTINYLTISTMTI